MRLLLRRIAKSELINLFVIMFWSMHSDTSFYLRYPFYLRKSTTLISLIRIWIILSIYFEDIATCLFLMQHWILHEFSTLSWDSLHTVYILSIVEILFIVLNFPGQCSQTFNILRCAGLKLLKFGTVLRGRLFFFASIEQFFFFLIFVVYFFHVSLGESIFDLFSWKMSKMFLSSHLTAVVRRVVNNGVRFLDIFVRSALILNLGAVFNISRR